jgi:hypothetical protein
MRPQLNGGTLAGLPSRSSAGTPPNGRGTRGVQRQCDGRSHCHALASLSSPRSSCLVRARRGPTPPYLNHPKVPANSPRKPSSASVNSIRISNVAAKPPRQNQVPTATGMNSTTIHWARPLATARATAWRRPSRPTGRRVAAARFAPPLSALAVPVHNVCGLIVTAYLTEQPRRPRTSPSTSHKAAASCPVQHSCRLDSSGRNSRCHRSDANSSAGGARAAATRRVGPGLGPAARARHSA